MTNKTQYFYLGECRIMDYPVIIVADSEQKAQDLLLAEHRQAHQKEKTGIVANTWDELEDITECSIRQVGVNQVYWP